MKTKILNILYRHGFFVGMTLFASSTFHASGAFSRSMTSYLIGAVIVTIMMKGIHPK